MFCLPPLFPLFPVTQADSWRAIFASTGSGDKTRVDRLLDSCIENVESELSGQIRWTTCKDNCFWDASEALLPCWGDLTFSVVDLVAGSDLTPRVSFKLYQNYTENYEGCSGRGCGSLMYSGRGGQQTVQADTWYLMVLDAADYYRAYFTLYVPEAGVSTSFRVVRRMSSNQERVVLSWTGEADLDLWSYTPDWKTYVGWELDFPRADLLAGGTVRLDVDSPSGLDGPETMSFQNLNKGEVEVWVNHYSGVFTQLDAEENPAIVQVYCHWCVVNSEDPSEGRVLTVIQDADDPSIEGTTWWLVGKFFAPSPSKDNERVEWQTCTSGCYIFDEPSVQFVARDFLTQEEFSGIEVKIYTDYPPDYMGCTDMCGTHAGSVSGGAGDFSGQVPAQGWYLFVARVQGYYDAYVEMWVG